MRFKLKKFITAYNITVSWHIFNIQVDITKQHEYIIERVLYPFSLIELTHNYEHIFTNFRYKILQFLHLFIQYISYELKLIFRSQLQSL